MTIGEGIAREIEAEAKTTTRFLERFDDARADFKPHDRSMSAARLAGHIVESPQWALSILEEEVFDFATSGYKPPTWNTKAELLENHDRITAAFAAKLRESSDEALHDDWEMRTGEKVFFKGPRVVAIRSFIISHLIHHRGQLSVYYRLLGIPVPGAYGPSADDPSPTASGGDGEGARRMTPAKGKPFWTPEDNALLKRLVDAGTPYAEISERLGRKPGALRAQVYRLGISVAAARDLAVRQTLRQTVLRLFEAGATREELLVATGRSYFWLTKERRAIEQETGRRVECRGGRYSFALVDGGRA